VALEGDASPSQVDLIEYLNLLEERLPLTSLSGVSAAALVDRVRQLERTQRDLIRLVSQLLAQPGRLAAAEREQLAEQLRQLERALVSP
jgi:hypothetical protein